MAAVAASDRARRRPLGGLAASDERRGDRVVAARLAAACTTPVRRSGSSSSDQSAKPATAVGSAVGDADPDQRVCCRLGVRPPTRSSTNALVENPIGGSVRGGCSRVTSHTPWSVSLSRPRWQQPLTRLLRGAGDRSSPRCRPAVRQLARSEADACPSTRVAVVSSRHHVSALPTVAQGEPDRMSARLPGRPTYGRRADRCRRPRPRRQAASSRIAPVGVLARRLVRPASGRRAGTWRRSAAVERTRSTKARGSSTRWRSSS